MTIRDSRPSVRLAAVLLVVLASAVLLEGMSRLAFAFREDLQGLPGISGFLQRSLILDAYEMPSPDGGYHWVLRPGYAATASQLLSEKAEAGRVVGLRALKAANNGLSINRDGFKGPEIDPSHSRIRILALGDSTTFGTAGFDYPRVMEAILNRDSTAVEVINGGVEGYSPRNLLRELERYKNLKPNIVTLYIGWNAIYARDPNGQQAEDISRLIWAGRRIIRMARIMLEGDKNYALGLYGRKLHPDPGSRAVADLNNHQPWFMGLVESLVDGLESAGARVVLVTLPGLFTMDEKPTAKALSMGHLPEYTLNPYVLAKLTERYNGAVRALAKRRRLMVVDLAAWSRDALRPRDAYFTDSVHLTPAGLEKIGAYMGRRLKALVDQIRKE